MWWLCLFYTGTFKPPKSLITYFRGIFLQRWLPIGPTCYRQKNTDLWNLVCFTCTMCSVYNVSFSCCEQQKKVKAFGASCILGASYLGHEDYIFGSDGSPWFSPGGADLELVCLCLVGIYRLHCAIFKTHGIKQLTRKPNLAISGPIVIIA